MAACEGWIHSVETAGMVDGPGVRYVVFTSGCPLRCLYCHNPDARRPRGGPRIGSDELLQDLARYASFLTKAGGGLTVSGGEPLLQPEFVTELLQGAKRLGLHTTLDTSGFGGDRAPQALLDATDLVLLDVKSWDRETYRRVTGVGPGSTVAFARRLAGMGKPVWVRFVLVPGLTDAPANVAGVADFVATLPNVERVDVLPFHKMGEAKWKALGMRYTLGATPVPTAAEVEGAREHFRQRELTVA